MIDRQAQRQLLQLAHRALQLFVERQESYAPNTDELVPMLKQPASSFVTLSHGDRLRGCIGSTHARLPLYVDLVRNTIAAARDPRFEPVSREDLPGIVIEISLLGPFHSLDYVNSDDLMGRLRPGIDGVIISWQERRGLLLPQVWERLQKPEQFMQALCQKARIPWHAFDAGSPQVTVATFEVLHFTDPVEKGSSARPAPPQERPS